ncbi:MAG TPA: sugar phosphate isomerase/epimerase family protein [Chthonomonadaceae bacterium]|nr:sugar phosphate isomerase/epimerase family protein [Chthonomonadaceae bacterium]
MWKLGLHSVSYAGVWDGQVALPLEQFVDHAADLGYQGVMLMAKRGHASLLDMTEGRRSDLRARMRDRGLELAALAGYTDFTANADRADIPFLEMQVVYVRECARLAHDLGGGIVRIFTGYESDRLTPGQGWLRCVKAVRDCARLAADFGVTLAVQNHHDIAVHYQALADFIDEVGEPNVKAGFDAWAPVLQGLSGPALAESVRALGPRIAQTIVADYVLQPRFHYAPSLTSYTPAQPEAKAVPVGEGIIDYETFFTALKQTGFDGYVTYEMCSAIRGGGSQENIDRCARRFVEWMARWEQA